MPKYSSSNEFRSDTFTTPTQSMLETVFQASVGDSVYSEDDDTNALEKRIAELTGKEAGLYCISGTLANQIAVRTNLVNPPYSVLCDHRSHIYVHEAAGLATLSQAMIVPVVPSNGCYMTLEDIQKKINVDDGDIHGAPTRLISLENTCHGVVYPIEELRRIREYCNETGIPLHCDGARLWNASVASGVSFKEYGEIFDSISICLSKSLGAPIGSVLVGSKKFIKKANHWRKQNGGGVRQSGLLARMADVAITENLPEIVKSHQMAKDVADFLTGKGLKLAEPCQTNFVFLDVEKSPIDLDILAKYGEKYNVRVWPGRISFHFQNDQESVENVKKAFWDAYQETQKLGLSNVTSKTYVSPGEK
ncbi:Low specificity L-threonine aldolase [Cyberlindnera fabianii]|uniref:low-specificity L-threonine aldolase n=1 Tax=Cyberlindnera fabianii TaxID=36022 RepID=A0A1V2L1W0_CYBFA|nr:Low specificity L-threonine aldolase [Cyberlindnera fabianii]